MGRRSTTGGVTPKGDRIQVRLEYRGREIRPTLALRPTATNLKHAARLRLQMLAEIDAGTFSLAHHFPDYPHTDQHDGDADERTRTFATWAEKWLALAARNREHSTLTVYRNHLNAYWVRPFGHLVPRRITHELLLTHLAQLASDRVNEETGQTEKALSRKTQNNILIPLRGVFELITKAGAVSVNPADGIDCLRVQTGNPDPFTAAEVDLILAELAKPRANKPSAVAAAVHDYFEFSFFTGLRASEQIALTWADVDLRGRTVAIRRTRVLQKEKERTKTHRARIVELNDRAFASLERQRARTQLAGGKVFLNPWTGSAWNNTEEQRREWVDCLRRAGVRYRPPKECRDTSVTMLLTAGCDPYWVAAQHGHSIQTMQKDYAAWIPKADKGRNLQAANAALRTGALGAESGAESAR